MTSVQKKRLRRRRRRIRNFKRMILGIMLAPARMPRITTHMADSAMHASEILGAVFVAVLMAHLFNPSLFKTPIVVVVAIIFFGLLTTVKLSEYQYQLEERSYYGFNL